MLPHAFYAAAAALMIFCCCLPLAPLFFTPLRQHAKITSFHATHRVTCLRHAGAYVFRRRYFAATCCCRATLLLMPLIDSYQLRMLHADAMPLDAMRHTPPARYAERHSYDTVTRCWRACHATPASAQYATPAIRYDATTRDVYTDDRAAAITTLSLRSIRHERYYAAATAIIFRRYAADAATCCLRYDALFRYARH